MVLMKNVVLVTVDCLRADHMGCYGYKRDTSPFLDRLSKKGLFFKNAFSNGPNTRHSVPSFLSSTYPLLFFDEAKGGRLSSGRKTLAEVLKKKGYTTLAVHSNPYVSKFYGYDRGFDFFNDFLMGQVDADVDRNIFSKIISDGFKGLKAVLMKKLPHETGEQINKEVFKILEDVEGPFFCWVHYMDVHMPYVPPNRFLHELDLKSFSHIKKVWMGKKINDLDSRDKIKDSEIEDYVDLYDGCIRYNDWILKDFIKKLEEKYPDTIFIITADHGEEFREHGGLSHVEKLYDELLHVPLFFYGKDVKSNTIKKPVSLLNLAPSILYLLGFGNDFLFQGENFLDSEDFVIAEAYRDKPIFCYRDLEWKIIFNESDIEIYDIKKDPGETRNLYDSMKDKKEFKSIKNLIDRHIEDLKKERKKRKTSLQESHIKKVARRLKNI